MVCVYVFQLYHKYQPYDIQNTIIFCVFAIKNVTFVNKWLYLNYSEEKREILSLLLSIIDNKKVDTISIHSILFKSELNYL